MDTLRRVNLQTMVLGLGFRVWWAQTGRTANSHQKSCTSTTKNDQSIDNGNVVGVFFLFNNLQQVP